MDFNQTWHIASLCERLSHSFKYRTIQFYKEEDIFSLNQLGYGIIIALYKCLLLIGTAF